MLNQFRSNCSTETVGLIVIGLCVGLGMFGLAKSLHVSDGVAFIGTLVLAFFLVRGPAILAWRRIDNRIYRHYDPVFWAAFPIFAASRFVASADARLAQVLAILIAAILYLIGSRRTCDWYFDKVEKAVTAVRCPTHGKRAHFELRHNGKRQYMWVEACCEETKDAAKAAAQEVFCS